jgi:hypothetical protein
MASRALGDNHGALVWGCCLLVLAGVAIHGGFDWRKLTLRRGEWGTFLSSLFCNGTHAQTVRRPVRLKVL